MIHLLFILIIFCLVLWQVYNFRQSYFVGGDVDKIFGYNHSGKKATYFPIVVFVPFTISIWIIIIYFIYFLENLHKGV